MSQSVSALHSYSPLEERLNALSHGLGTIAAIVGLVLLLQRAEDVYSQLIVSLYGSSMILMFLSSTLYHSLSEPILKSRLKTLDHSAIYLLIAGTYTPFMLLAVGGWVGGLAMVLIWGIAIVGILCKCFANGRFPKLSVITYLLMGWLALVFIYPLYQALPPGGLWLLVSGGLCYTLGVAFYVAKKINYTHAIWHIFVTLGCVCHFFAIYLFVI